MKKAYLINIVLLLASALFILIFLEITLQILIKEPKLSYPKSAQHFLIPERIWIEPHPVLGWFHQKNKQAFLKEGNKSSEININSGGFRGTKNYSKEKTYGIKRILLLGDSFMFGWGVGDDETLGAELEKMMPNIQTLNLGVAGYGIDQILLVFELIGKEFHPDIVIIGVYPEDFWRATRAFTDSGSGKPYFVLNNGKLELYNVPVQGPQELGYVQFPQIIKTWAIEQVLKKSHLYRYLRYKTLRLARDLGWIDPELTDDWLLGSAILKQLVREIREINSKPAILLIPPDRWMKNTKSTSFQKSIYRFGERENVPVVDSTDYLIDEVNQHGLLNVYDKVDGHWSPGGHKIGARTLSRLLRTNFRIDTELKRAIS